MYTEGQDYLKWYKRHNSKVGLSQITPWICGIIIPCVSYLQKKERENRTFFVAYLHWLNHTQNIEQSWIQKKYFVKYMNIYTEC